MTTSDEEDRAFFAKPIKAAKKRSPKLRSTSAIAPDSLRKPQQGLPSDLNSPRLDSPPFESKTRVTRKRITLSSSDEASDGEGQNSRNASRRKLLFARIGAGEDTDGVGAKGGKDWRDHSSEKDGGSVATSSKLHSLPRPPARPALQENAATKSTDSRNVSKAKSVSLSPPPAAQQQNPNPKPIRAQTYWGPAPAAVVKPPPKVPFEASKRLASLSTLGKKISRAVEVEEEIDMLDEVEELKDVVGGDGNYLTHEASVKQKKAAQLR